MAALCDMIARHCSDQGVAFFLAGMAVKGVLVLVVAFAAGAALRKASASVRHMVWTAALAALVALPLLSLALPSLDLRVMPQAVVSAPAPAAASPPHPRAAR